jgi:hypothetical protein
MNFIPDPVAISRNLNIFRKLPAYAGGESLQAEIDFIHHCRAATIFFFSTSIGRSRSTESQAAGPTDWPIPKMQAVPDMNYSVSCRRCMG